MGCCNNPNYQSRAARESINRSAYEACQCADRSCECKDLAEQYAQNAEDTWNDFQTRYLGAYAVAPVTSTTGALYFNSASNTMFVWNGTMWATFSAIPDGDKGDITVSGAGTTWTVDNGLAGTKINPNFGSQNITTTGNIGVGTAPTSYKGDFLGNSNALIGIRVYNQNSNSSAETVVQFGNDTNSAAAALRLNSSTNVASGGPNALSLINGLNAPIVLSTNLTERVRVEGDGDVGIGTTPTASAILDVSSTTKGFLPPRMTTAQRDAITSPAQGLVIYNTSTNKINIFNGSSWIEIASGSFVEKSGDTMTGKLIAAADATASKLNIGSALASGAPTTLVDGDLWITNQNKLAFRSTGTTINAAGTNQSNTYSQPQTISSTSNAAPVLSASNTGTREAAVFNAQGTVPAVRITQTGTGESFRVEDDPSTDSTPFVIDANGNVGVGKSPTSLVDISKSDPGNTLIKIQNTSSTGISGAHLFNDTGTFVCHFGWGNSGTSVSDRMFIGTIESNPLVLTTDDIERVRVKPLGQVRFVPLASAPTSPEAGDVYYDSSTNKLRCYNGTIWNDLF